MTAVQRWTLAVVCTATAILMLDIAVVNTALPSIGEDLKTGIGGLQWVVDAYTLALAAVVLTAGSLADRFGRRRVFASGLVVFTVASGACAAAGSIEMLDAARAVQGLGAAILFATSLALLADAFPSERERAGALAAYGATIGASFAIGPAVGGALTTALDWRWVFLVNIPIGIAVLAVTLREVRESRDPRAPRVDVPGLVTLTAGLFLLVFGLLRGNEDGWGSPIIVASLAGAAALLAAFVAIEARSSHPMLPLGLLRSRAFTGAQLTAFAISGSFFAIYLYCSIYLQSVLGLSALEAGLVFVPSTLVMVVVSGATAQLGQRVHPGVLISGGLVLVAAGMALMTRRPGRLVVDRAAPGHHRGADRHRAVQPVGERRRAELGPRRAERPRGRRQRHVPPGRHRDRRRRPRRADPHRRPAERRLGRRLRRRHAHGAARRRGPRRGRRDRRRAPDQPPRRDRRARAGLGRFSWPRAVEARGHDAVPPQRLQDR